MSWNRDPVQALLSGALSWGWCLVQVANEGILTGRWHLWVTQLSFYIEGGWGPERMGDLCEVTQLVGSRSSWAAQVHASFLSVMRRTTVKSQNLVKPWLWSINGNCTAWHSSFIRYHNDLLSECGWEHFQNHWFNVLVFIHILTSIWWDRHMVQSLILG